MLIYITENKIHQMKLIDSNNQIPNHKDNTTQKSPFPGSLEAQTSTVSDEK